MHRNKLERIEVWVVGWSEGKMSEKHLVVGFHFQVIIMHRERDKEV